MLQTKTIIYLSILLENDEKSHSLTNGMFPSRLIQGKQSILSKKLLLITSNSSKITLHVEGV
jgi:hypothetical protein